MIRDSLRRLGAQVGPAGRISVWLLAAALLFLALILKPLEARNAALEAEVAHGMQARRAGGAENPAPAQQLAAFYRFFETREQVTDWLAALDAAGKAAGVTLRTADYRMKKTATRLAHYEIALPVTGSYAQVRAFLDTALAKVPVMSLDRVSFNRKSPGEREVQADIRFTLFVVKP